MMLLEWALPTLRHLFKQTNRRLVGKIDLGENFLQLENYLNWRSSSEMK